MVEAGIANKYHTIAIWVQGTLKLFHPREPLEKGSY